MSAKTRHKKDDNRLVQAIAALTGGGTALTEHGRLLATGNTSPTERLASLLAELDQTVLHRELLLKSEGRDIAKLDVVERRVLRIQDLSERSQEAMEWLSGTLLTGADACRVFSFLSALSGRAQEVTVTSLLPSNGELAAAEGVTCHALLALRHVQDAVDRIPEALRKTVFEAISLSQSCVAVYKGQRLFADGPLDKTETLQLLLSDQLSSQSSRQIKAWHVGGESAYAVMRVTESDFGFAAIAANERFDSCIRLWRPNS